MTEPNLCKPANAQLGCHRLRQCSAAAHSMNTVQRTHCCWHSRLLLNHTNRRAPVRAARSTKRKHIHRCAREQTCVHSSAPKGRHSQAPAEHTVADHLPASFHRLLLVACELPTLLQLVPLHLQLAFPLHTVGPHAFLSRSLVINSLLLYWSHCC